MTSASKNVYFDKLHDLVNKYNNTYHSTIKIKHLLMQNQTHILILVKKLIKRRRNCCNVFEK